MKILIAEDTPVNQVLLADFLEPYGECHVARDGFEAVKIFEQSLSTTEQPFDLLCLDIMMPKMDGQAVLQTVRKLEEEQGIAEEERVKVLMITALDDSKNIMEALVKGKCAGYLTKPVSRATLQEQLALLGLG